MKRTNGLVAAKKGRHQGTTVVLAVGMVLGLGASVALATNNPIPGIDIIVKKKPGGIMVTRPSDASGRFSMQVTEPGAYTVSGACPKQAACPPYVLAVSVGKVPLKPGADGSLSFTARAPVVLSVLVHGDARLPGQVPGTRSLSTGTADPPLGPASSIINTSRSNIKHPSIAQPIEPPPPDQSTRQLLTTVISDAVADGGPEGDRPTRASAQTTIFDRWGNRRLDPSSPPKGGMGVLPGIQGDPLPGTDVGLEGDPGSIVIGTTTTDARGAYTFTKLVPGSYKITLAGQPPTKVEVGPNGTIVGKVVVAKDGKGREVVPDAADVQRR